MIKTLVITREENRALYLLGVGAEINLLDGGAVLRLILDPNSPIKTIHFKDHDQAQTVFNDIVEWLKDPSNTLLEIEA